MSSSIKFFHCPKQIKNISPLQIVDFACIRSKAFGVNFDNLKRNIQANGFVSGGGMITGFIIKYEDSLLAKLSKFRKDNLNPELEIIAVVDGAQRTEAICQLIEDTAVANFDKNTLINVAIPIDDYADKEWPLSDIVSAAHALNELSRTNIPVSFWDKLCGFVTAMDCIDADYKDLWAVGFRDTYAKTLFLLNLQNGLPDLLTGLHLVDRGQLRINSAVGTKFEKSLYALKSQEETIRVLGVYNKQCFSIDYWYRNSVKIMERLHKSWFFDIFQSFSDTGDLPDPYKWILEELHGCTVAELVKIGSLNLHHPIFQQEAFESLLMVPSIKEGGEILLTRFFHIACADAISDGALFPKTFFERQLNVALSGFKQLYFKCSFLNFNTGVTLKDLSEINEDLRQHLLKVLYTSSHEDELLLYNSPPSNSSILPGAVKGSALDKMLPSIRKMLRKLYDIQDDVVPSSSAPLRASGRESTTKVAEKSKRKREKESAAKINKKQRQPKKKNPKQTQLDDPPVLEHNSRSLNNILATLVLLLYF